MDTPESSMIAAQMPMSDISSALRLSGLFLFSCCSLSCMGACSFIS